MIKKLSVCVFCFFALWFFSNKVDAASVSYCDYGDNLSLPMPVTIGVKIDGINTFYPFEQIYDLHEDISYFVYDKASCNNYINIPYINPKEYWVTYQYYYKYNDTITYTTTTLGGGKYTTKDLTSPSIYSLVDSLSVNVGEYMELDQISSYVYANDAIDGERPIEITYDNYSDNYDKLGEYSIIFKACDKSNNCSSLNFKINVVDRIAPIIEGPSNIESYMSNPLNINTLPLNFKAIDNYDGDISSDIYIVSHDYNPNLLGNYSAYLSVLDSSNNAIKNNFKVTITVIDDIAPVIEGPTLFNSKLSNIISTKTILSNMIVSDNIDKNAYKNLYILDDAYSSNQTRIGTYTLILSCYDSSQNETLPYIITINVIDDILPTIDGEKNYNSYMSNPVSLLEIKSNLIVRDNYDGNLFNKLEILEDTYSNNKETIGIYHITFSVSDSSNNVSQSFNVEIVVYDDIIPIIEGVNYYKTLNTKRLDPISIKLSLNAIDNVDDNLSYKIELNEDSYSDNYSTVGTYFLSFYVCDRSGNMSNIFKVKIVVNEDLSFLQTIDNTYIYLDTSSLKDDSQILNILGVNLQDYSSISQIENTYSNNYNIEGEYFIKYQIENTDYSKEYITINIKTYNLVTPISNEPQSTSKEKKETIFSKIISFFKSMFSKIINFFKNLFC